MRVRTALGNIVLGRVRGYVIFTRLYGCVNARDSVEIEGVASHQPHRLARYTCRPFAVEWALGTPTEQEQP